MKNKMLTVLLVTAVVMVAACGSQQAGTITEFPLPNPNSFPNSITAGPDGNLWFTEESGLQIGRITPTGQITEFPSPGFGTTGAIPGGITAVPDGNLWFTECVPAGPIGGGVCTSSQIGRITSGK